jgi:hypothetical protein
MSPYPVGSYTAGHGSCDPRSTLVAAFFDSLNSSGTSYAVMNNYEDLPAVIPSDIDITVPADFFAILDGFILEFADLTGSRIVQKLWHGNKKCAYIVGTTGRGFLQLDFFVSFSTKSAPSLISHDDLIAGAWLCNGFRVPHPKVELLFIVMRRLFKNDWSERHCSRIAELRARITEEVWLMEPYEWLGQTIQLAISGDLKGVKSRRAGDWKQLRRTARQLCGRRGLVANALSQARRILYRLRVETGMIVVFEGGGVALDAETHKRLEILFHRHIHLNEECLNARGLLYRLLLPYALALLKRRKGLIFLSLYDESSNAGRLAARLARMDLVDLRVTGPQLLGDSLVDKIASLQAEKTRRAMDLGGTQTSGRRP